MTSLRAEIRHESPAHKWVQVWAGPDPEHRAKVGTLVMTPAEADDLVARVEAGERQPTFLDRLRTAVVEEGGDWTTRRAVDALGLTVTPERARKLLNQLADEGLLTRHGVRGYLWTPADGVQISPEIASHVLWHYDADGGQEPPAFIEALMSAIDAADPVNRRRLARAFPAYVAAMDRADYAAHGLYQLQRITEGGSS